MKRPVIVLAGPTASGKTAMAIQLAKRFDGEIVSADSMQIYRTLDIGTAKPRPEEREGVRHHMIDICDITHCFSVVDYCLMAHEAIADIHARGKLPIVAGGTGLYIDSLVYDVSYGIVGENAELRASLFALSEKEGAKALFSRLQSLDPSAAASLHPNNVKRVIRAIEIITATGRPLSESLVPPNKSTSRYRVGYIVLTRERQALYERIDRRVDSMMEQGLYEEAQRLFAAVGPNSGLTCVQAIGYKEFLPVIYEGQSLAAAVEQLKRDTRRYAKRQMTWFRKNEQATFVDCGQPYALDEVCRITEEML